MIQIRSETEQDIAAIRSINEAAFGGKEEADIVDKLRAQAGEKLSLVAQGDNGQLLGHIFFSPVTLHGDAGEIVVGMGLAPMSVLPEHQNRGIGSLLVQAGIERLRASGCPFIIVLGHAQYYPRFGFEPASQHNIHSQWDDIPDEVFMILILEADKLPSSGGVVRYSSAFDSSV